MSTSFSRGRDPHFVLLDQDFQRLSAFIHAQCGIKMPLGKKTQLTAMIQKRLQIVGKESCTDYVDWVLGGEQAEGELMQLVDFATNREVDFFHEAKHFEFMVQTALPELIKRSGAGVHRELMIWSAGCATGEEPYTLAMVLQEFARRHPGIPCKAQVLATDLSDQALATASNAIYNQEKVAPISPELKKKYFLKSKNPRKPLVRVVPKLRAMVKFRQLNMMEANFQLREKIDILFCRNVVTHFNRPTRKKLVKRLCRHLAPGGYLFVGHGESLHGLGVPVMPLQPTVYQMSA